MKRKKIISFILIAALLGGAGIAYYYDYESSHYIQTDNAKVTADLVTVYPKIQGEIKGWNVNEGDTVKEGQVLGYQDTSLMMQSSSVSTQGLDSNADIAEKKAEIKSPIDGRVVQTNVSLSQMVGTSTGVAIVADTQNSYIEANIKETDIAKVQIGQKVETGIDAYPNKKFIGYVTSIGQATGSVFSIIPEQNASGNYTKVTELIPVKISILNRLNADLIPGMNSTVKIHITRQ